MCGRYTLIKLSDFTNMFPWIRQPEQEIEPRYNIAPSTLCPIVRLDGDNHPGLSLAKWGLIPYWTKGKPKLAPINAKCETAATSGMFRQSIERDVVAWLDLLFRLPDPGEHVGEIRELDQRVAAAHGAPC